jgi:hypothetical protein
VYNTQTLLTLTRINADNTLTPLRQDSYLVSDALVAPDASGAVIADGNSLPAETPLRWLAADGRAAVNLPIVLDLNQGNNQMRWGK